MFNSAKITRGSTDFREMKISTIYLFSVDHSKQKKIFADSTVQSASETVGFDSRRTADKVAL
jgi:hypothetical protein